MRDVPGDFAVLTRPSAQGATLELTGELDMATLPQLDAAVAALDTNGGPGRLVVDLRGLRFLDSMGLEFLIKLNAATELIIVRGPRPVHRLFDVMQMESVLTIVDEPPEA
jgi:anti-anti-sigma factor